MANNSDEPSHGEPNHQPVLLDEVVDLLAPQPGQVIVDCTLGRGGHAAALMRRVSPDGVYIGLDLDADNLSYVRSATSDHSVTRHFVHRSFDRVRQVLDELQIDRVDGLLADLGFSSNQMDSPQRGFSFMADGPLDMRLDQTTGPTAADLLAELEEKDLADLLWANSQERHSRSIARKIVAQRAVQPIRTTRQLADLCVAAYARADAKGRGGSRRWRIHPATRTFQALRIVVNDELGRLERLLGQIDQLLSSEGRAAIISFHSLEDRMVKQAFLSLAQQDLAHRLTRKPITPGDPERNANPRSRSAKLRAIQWL